MNLHCIHYALCYLKFLFDRIRHAKIEVNIESETRWISPVARTGLWLIAEASIGTSNFAFHGELS